MDLLIIESHFLINMKELGSRTPLSWQFMRQTKFKDFVFMNRKLKLSLAINHTVPSRSYLFRQKPYTFITIFPTVFCILSSSKAVGASSQSYIFPI
jgi:hypothetical protein